MAPPRGGLKGLYRQRKKGAGAGAGAGVAKPTPKRKSKKTQPQQEDAADEYGAEEAALRQFDMDTCYGPCIGVTRLRRWERAAAMGLRPPPHVRDLILRHQHHGDGSSSLLLLDKKNDDDSLSQLDHCLWAGKV